MPVKNFLEIEPRLSPCHDGNGIVKVATVFEKDELSTDMQFLHYTVLPPNTNIGLHTHKDDEEFYIILEGGGVMDTDGQRVSVRQGDAILNKPFGTHSLYNTSDSSDLKMLVFKVDN